MYIHTIPNRQSKPAVLLRESYREGDKVRNRTLANLSALSDRQIDLFRRVLKNEPLLIPGESLKVIQSRHHGHVHAVLVAMEQLDFASILGSQPSRERDLVIAMVVSRIVAPATKLSTLRWWNTTSLAQTLNIADATDDALYEAMDWLFARQSRIEKKLAKRHLHQGGVALFDLSSTYMEGEKCPLAAYGHNRDGKEGKKQVNFGLLTDRRGCPVSISVFNGNTADPTTFLPQVTRLREEFDIQEMVLVGDRGMITQTSIDILKKFPRLSWITALRSETIRSLMPVKGFQFGLFDQRNLMEFTHPDFLGERLVACHNEDLAKRRASNRLSLLARTVKELEKVRASVDNKRLRGAGKIGVRVGRIIDRFKMAKHFITTIEEQSFRWNIDLQKVEEESTLDGIYIIRTNLPSERMSAVETVRNYKQLAKVELAFRSLKQTDMEIRPVHHRLADRVRAHIFLCMLAYYVKWHMMEAWRSLLFAQESPSPSSLADPVSPAKRSQETLNKVHSKKLPDGSEVHSFRSLLTDLATIVRNTCVVPESEPDTITFVMETTPSPKQEKALSLLRAITM